MRHVAIIHPRYLEMILAGRKRVEVRLTRNRSVPFGLVAPGDIVYFKARSGAFGARAMVSGVDAFEDLSPEAVAWLFRRYNAMACGGAEYWSGKQQARFATIIHLAEVRAVHDGPEYRKAPGYSPRGAWFVLGKAASGRASHRAATRISVNPSE